MKLDPVLDRVRKLLRLSTSSNANEAASAAAKAQELIERHQLDAALLALDDAEPARGLDDEPIVSFDDAPLDTPKQLDRWRGWLAVEIAKANACKVWADGTVLKIVGRPSDAETMRYVYGWLTREVERLTSAVGLGKGRTWRNNFRLGVVETIARKFKEQHERTIHDFRAEAGDNVTALMRVDNAITRVTERRMDVYRWVKTNMKLYVRCGGEGAFDQSARSAGRKAGESISLNASRGHLVNGRGLPSAGDR